ncbi:transposase, partial [Acinetobacter baumannii]
FLSAQKFQVPVCDYAISHDHVHFITKVPSREAYVRFIRALTGRLALYFGKNLFESIFTRIAESAFDYRTLLAFCQKNRDEALRN